ncbi:hypothetical protein SLW70_03145 [Flavobacterium sp. NG2]|uniref:hypothetical protein n=1 Tax=Flavobacterium sp. NG2 TaxID=3097547 RepID=UPI002A836799|nr:hypothetical protein [Flavobacterium sp. NG2]WPR72150.1 hypothetical protein SLW70_03145 [Flavobacterium sp. NG2]
MKHVLCLSIVFFIVLWSCETTQVTDKGILEGKINIGPLCPVETIPPKPECIPTKETYDNWPIYIWTLDKKEKIAVLQPELNGNYTIELPVGSYIIDLEKQHRFGKNLPATVTIKNMETTPLDINIDTGIR